jgi:UDPglucose 6-dehydrogenase
LIEVGATVRAYDPAVEDNTDRRLSAITVVTDPYEAVAGADVLAVLTEWPDFRDLDMVRVGEAMASKQVVDARNLLDREALKELGFAYDGIGRS